MNHLIKEIVMTRKMILIVLILGISIYPAFAQIEEHLENLEGPFESPQEVTETCLMCHEDAGEDILHTQHWNWLGDEFKIPGDDTRRTGKQIITRSEKKSTLKRW